MVGIPKSDEWVISFSLRIPKEGYHWVSSPERGDWELVENWSEEWGLDPIMAFEHVEGLKAGRDVLYQFRELGERLKQSWTIAPWETVPDDTLPRQWILEFANKFGPLYEHAEMRESNVDWWKDAMDIADLWQIRHAFKTADFTEVRSRIYTTGSGSLAYRRSSGGGWVFADRNTALQVRSAKLGQRENAPPDYVERAKVLGIRTQAWMVVSHVLNVVLHSGLGLRLHPLKENNPIIVPRGVMATACVRLWLDIVHRYGDGLDEAQTCKQCGQEIEGTRRKQFCGDTCRKAYNRSKVVS